MNSIRVLFDISALGNSRRYNFGRAGVCRMVEETLAGLIHSQECELSFCATESLETVAAAVDYLNYSPMFGKVPLFTSRTIEDIYLPLHRACVLPDHWGKLPFSQQIIQRFAWRLRTILESNASVLDPVYYREKDIFHSPISALPNRASMPAKTVRFLTVHDLIQINHPEYFGSAKLSSDSSGNSATKSIRDLKYALDNLCRDDWVICVSEATKADLCNYKPDLDPNHIVVIPLAASEQFYPRSAQEVSQARDKYSLGDQPYILSVSTLEPRKNLTSIIRSFAALVQQEKLKDLQLVLVGAKGWQFDSILEEIANQRHLQERIIVTGYVEDRDLPALYSGALAFVYPSFVEGFGLPPLEAMQCGTPVITSNISSLPEVVGDAAITINPRDLDALSESMFQLYRDASLRIELSTRSLKRSQQFSWEKCVRSTLSTYRLALAER